MRVQNNEGCERLRTDSVFELLHRQFTQKVFSNFSKNRGIAEVWGCVGQGPT